MHVIIAIQWSGSIWWNPCMQIHIMQISITAHQVHHLVCKFDSLSLNVVYSYFNSRLADLASFHRNVSVEYQLTSKNLWVCFGGSYPGALSAWFRIKVCSSSPFKEFLTSFSCTYWSFHTTMTSHIFCFVWQYPHLVHAAVASSAPVQAIVDFQGYNNVVGKSLASPIVNGSEQVSCIYEFVLSSCLPLASVILNFPPSLPIEFVWIHGWHLCMDASIYALILISCVISVCSFIVNHVFHQIRLWFTWRKCM